MVLKKSDKNYISKAPSVLSYWFVDCVYYGVNTDLEFMYNFTKADEDHMIETLVVADFTPLPPPTTVAPPTTSTAPTTTTKGATTKGTPSTSTTAKTVIKNNNNIHLYIIIRTFRQLLL